MGVGVYSHLPKGFFFSKNGRGLGFSGFFFFNIHTSDKLEIFFDHSILVNGVDPWGVHRFLGGINHENGIYSMGQRHECGFYRNRVSEFWPLAIE